MPTDATIEKEPPKAGEPEAAGTETLAPSTSAIEPLPNGNKTFWRALLLALALHGLMFVPLVGFSGHPTLQRRMGEEFGDHNAINVDVIEPRALSGDSENSPPPAPPASLPEQQQQEQPVKEEPAEKPSAKVEPPAKEPAKQPPQKTAAAQMKTPEPQPQPPADLRGATEPERPVAEKPVPSPEAAKAAEQAALVKELTEMFAPDPPRKTAPPAKQPPREKSPNAEPSVLDNPPQFTATSSSFARPADITRSGENDEFGRGVIRALRQTMPVPWGVKARVTIMFYLNEAGRVVELRLVQGSGYPLVDQSVVFAAGNAPFPQPPRGSKRNDRIFLVTYIYE